MHSGRVALGSSNNGIGFTALTAALHAIAPTMPGWCSTSGIDQEISNCANNFALFSLLT